MCDDNKVLCHHWLFAIVLCTGSVYRFVSSVGVYLKSYFLGNYSPFVS